MPDSEHVERPRRLVKRGGGANMLNVQSWRTLVLGTGGTYYLPGLPEEIYRKFS